jgi:prevent-host-death family protein
MPKAPEAPIRAFNLAEAKARLSSLVRRAEQGEVILIKRYGRVVAKLVPAAASQGEHQKAPLRPKRTPGVWKGKVRIAQDFDEVDAEIAELMAEGPVEPSS